MSRSSYPLILLPAASLAVFLVQLLRLHGYESLSNPLFAVLVALFIIPLVLASWVGYSRFLSSFAGIAVHRALVLDLLSYLPLLFLLLYLLPPIRSVVNIGTVLFFSTLAGCAAFKLAILAYYRRSALRAILSRPYLMLGATLAVALLLRVSLIAVNRFHGDEALYSHWGLLIASGRDIFLRYGVIVDKPPVFLYTLAAFFKLFGPTETAARLPNVIASLAGIAILYHIALELFDRRTAILSALFLTFSPFDLQFAPTAFTDPLMVALSLASCLLALKGRYLVAGVVIGLAVMTKPFAVLFVPLLLFFANIPLSREGFAGRFARSGLRLGSGFMIVVFAVVCWDLFIRVNCVNFFTASAARYGGLRVVPLVRILPRLQRWIVQLQYLTGSRMLNVILLAGAPTLVFYGLWRRRARRGWLFDLVLSGFFLCFVAVHTLLSFSIWDRYLLGLVPVVALLLSRVTLLPYDALLNGERFSRAKLAYTLILGVFLFAALLQPTRVALRYGFPVGGDHGAFQGIDDVADYFRGNVPPGSIVFHKWLAWHYSFYLFDHRLEYYWYPSFEFILDTSKQLSSLQKYIVFPSWTSSQPLGNFLMHHAWTLHEVYRTYRADGTVAFTIYRIQPLEE